MSATKGLTDRFGRPYTYLARVIYPSRRGSFMELIEGTALEQINDTHGLGLRIRRSGGKEVVVRNLRDVIVVPFYHPNHEEQVVESVEV